VPAGQLTIKAPTPKSRSLGGGREICAHCDKCGEDSGFVARRRLNGQNIHWCFLKLGVSERKIVLGVGHENLRSIQP